MLKQQLQYKRQLRMTQPFPGRGTEEKKTRREEGSSREEEEEEEKK
jgi:hypothetical protein